MARWEGKPRWSDAPNVEYDPNSWSHQRVNDEADSVRRGVRFESATSIQSIRYSNGDIWYRVSASAGGSVTVTFASATKNTGAQNIVYAVTPGQIIVATQGGTLVGSATLSTTNGVSVWRSDGASWITMFSTEASGLPVPLVVDDITVNGSATISGTVTVKTALSVSGTLAAGVANVGSLSVSGNAVISGNLTVTGSVTLSGTLNMTVQPVFPTGTVTSITNGAIITHAGNLFYEMSVTIGGSLALPDPSTMVGRQASIKLKSSNGELRVFATGSMIEGSSATISMSGNLEYATLIAGQTSWWIIG